MKSKKNKLMNFILFEFVLLGILGYFIDLHGQNIMHLVGGTIRYEDGSIPPKITFNAYITTRQGSILNESSPGCGYTEGYYWVQCGHFPEKWNAGEILHLDFQDEYGYSISGEVTLTYSEIDTLNLLFIIPTYHVTLLTEPSGLECIVNDSQFTTPYLFEVVLGTVSTISMVSPQSGDPGIQYIFEYWSDQKPQTHSINIISDTTLTATFIPQYRFYTNQEPETGGMVQLNPENEWYTTGTQVEVTAISDSANRFTFWQWSGDLSGNENPDTLTVDHVMYVVAHFKLPDYTIETKVNPEGYGIVLKFPEKESYEYQELVHLFADPVEGCRFDYWSGNLAAAENPIEVIIDSSLFVIANFKGTPTGLIDQNIRYPSSYGLNQNYPNPFNPSTEIKYLLPCNSKVRLIIFNLKGEVITTLVNREQPPGQYMINWNATDNSGRKVVGGIYLFRIVANGETSVFTETKKMLLLK